MGLETTWPRTEIICGALCLKIVFEPRVFFKFFFLKVVILYGCTLHIQLSRITMKAEMQAGFPMTLNVLHILSYPVSPMDRFHHGCIHGLKDNFCKLSFPTLIQMANIRIFTVDQNSVLADIFLCWNGPKTQRSLLVYAIK